MTEYASNLGKVLRCQEILGPQFNNKLNCLKTLQNLGQSLAWEGRLLQIPKNDRVAVFGDVIAKAFLCEHWLATGRSKGEWSNIHDLLLGNKNLGKVGKKHKLDECIILNTGTTNVSNAMMATAVEALFAAVYLDAGFEALGKVLENLEITHELLKTIAT